MTGDQLGNLAAQSHFTWDEHKRHSNIAKHGIDSKDARHIFDDAILVAPSPYADEERYVAPGKVIDRIIAAIFTMGQNTFRIISARRARKNEETTYYVSISQDP